MRPPSVYCWGEDFASSAGEFKSGYASPIPAIVEGLSDASAVVVGDERACAVVAGQLFCWGGSDIGALGDGGGVDWTSWPVAVSSLSDVSSVALGTDHTCARSPHGVACWGSDVDEQLGDGHEELWNIAVPQDVAGLANVEAIDGRWHHSCAVIEESGKVMCWGRNSDGAVDPLGPATPVARPREVAGLGDFGAVRVTTGASHSCAVNRDGIATCWGRNVFSGSVEAPTTVPLPESRFALYVAAGERHTCVVAEDTATATTEVYCWGQNGSGQLGLGDTEARPAPTLVEFPVPIANIDGITAGDSHTCAWQDNGPAFYCWGENGVGQLGAGDLLDRLSPTPVKDIAYVSRAEAGFDHTCAEHGIPWSTATAVSCWGGDDFGEQGNGANQGSAVAPQLVGTELSLLGAGGDGVCARNMAAGSNLCWGDNVAGQLAGPSLGQLHMPSPTAFGSIADAAPGSTHTCVLTLGGTVQCAGSSLFGQRGDGSRLYVTTPLFVDHLFRDGFD